jgi:hypothetical protein
VRISIRIDSVNEQHMRFTIFQDGGNAGQLCMNTNAARIFFDTLHDNPNFVVELNSVA